MGHALNDSIQDTLIRYHRMRGQRTKWILGTDHAGIATQTAGREGAGRAEGTQPRGARARGVRRARLGVARAVRRARSSSSSSGSGRRATTSDERFTLDAAYAQAVLKVFVDLYEKGYIYRDRYMVNWDPGQSLGDLRPRGRGPRGHRHALLHRLPARVGLAARSRSRPCGRRRCSPTPRSRSTPTTSATARLVGETAILPLVGRRLKIIADEYVKPEFGTGALKITPGHDPNDFEIGRRHGLPQLDGDRRGRPDDRARRPSASSG